ncbi:MAG TPA: hypothetical protein VF202_01125 [Trueperaceae bacterium]
MSDDAKRAAARRNLRRARAVREQQLLAEIDPEGTLDPQERARRLAEHQRAHMAKLSARAVQVRQAKRVDAFLRELISDAVQAVVAAAPPLTPAQLDTLRRLVAPVAPDRDLSQK